jgi:hypothetical protein
MKAFAQRPGRRTAVENTLIRHVVEQAGVLMSPGTAEAQGPIPDAGDRTADTVAQDSDARNNVTTSPWDAT